MKKILLSVLVLGLCVSLFTACKPNDSPVINVYNWGEYMDTALNDKFTEKTGIKVNYKNFETNEMMYSHLKSGGASYDVIFPSDYMVARLIEEDMLEPLDLNNIPNAKDVDTKLLNPNYDPQNLYSVPYAWGTVGLIYNTKFVKEPVTSWAPLFDPQYAGKILMFDNSRDAFAIALEHLGYSLNTENEDEIREAFELLKTQKSIVQAYAMDQIFDKMTAEEAILGPYYAGDFLTMREDNPDLAFVVPEEGSNIFVDVMCVPKNAPNKEAAEKYIDFMCNAEAALANAKTTGYSTPMVSAYNQLDDAIKNDGISYPSEAVRERCDFFNHLDEATRLLYDDLWTQLISQ